MSLVEMALKKMQEAAGRKDSPSARPVRGNGAIGELIDRNGVHRALVSADPAHRPDPDKIIRVDERALAAAGLLAPEHQQRELTAQYRHVKRPLIAAAVGRGGQKIDGGQAIMIASAMSGEGKTFTAINLALSMSLERDTSVLLVDADVAKPHISRTFGVERESGLLDVLRDQKLAVESCILPTDHANLSVLPAGQRSETATELLASHRMEETLHRLTAAAPNRIVLVDSPPLLLTSESRALAHWVGQVVIVVRADSTPQQAVLDAIAQVGDGRSISLVLNQCSMSTPGYYYGYGDSAAPTP